MENLVHMNKITCNPLFELWETFYAKTWQAALYAVPEETCASRLGWICLYWEKKIPYLHGSISSCEDADSISQNAALLSYEPQDFDFAARGMRMRIRTEPYRPERRPAVLTTA